MLNHHTHYLEHGYVLIPDGIPPRLLGALQADFEALLAARDAGGTSLDWRHQTILEPRFARHVLGAQVQLWTEYLPNPKRVEYMAFPRLSAMSEVVWTPRARMDFTNFLARLRTHGRRLEALDVGYRR